MPQTPQTLAFGQQMGLAPQKPTFVPQMTPPTPAPQQSVSQETPQGGTSLDPKIVNLAQAIRQTESNGNFSAKGASGEYGGYQFMPDTWNATAPKYGVNVPLEQATPAQQNEVAYKQLADWATEHPGWNVGNFASAWNAGPGKPDAYIQGNVGTNSKGVNYDTPAYAQKVAQAYQQLKAQNAQNVPMGGATQQTDQPASVGGFLGNIVSSGANFAGNLVNAVAHPLQTGQNLLETGAGALQELGGQTNDNTAKFDQLKNYFVNRYGGISNLEHTLYTDPVGFAADLSTVLGTGAGVAGLGAKAAELGGLGEVGSAATETTAATEASGLAGGLKATASALGTGAKYTNPLTPIVAGAGAALNKTKDLSDVIANPKDYTPENIAAASSEKITQDVQDAFEAKRATLSETGAGYAPFRETPTPITTAPADLDNILRDSLKVDVTDGVIKPTSTSLLRDTTSINKLQGVYNTYKTDFLNGSMDSEKLLNLRTDLAKIAYNDLGIKNTDVASLAAKVRGVVNDTYRSQVPGLSELDNSFSSQLNDLNDLQDGLIYKTGSNKGELKTSFINGAAKAVKNGDTDKLAQLEQIVPGITRRLEIMKTIKDLGQPGLATSFAEKSGVATGLVTGNFKGAALAFTAIILSKPEVAIPLMRAVGANIDLVKQVMANLSKSLTAGASLNNVQNTTPQMPTPQLATSQTPTQGESQTTQTGTENYLPLSSDLTSLATSKGFDLAAARNAGYSDADIQQFLQQN